MKFYAKITVFLIVHICATVILPQTNKTLDVGISAGGNYSGAFVSYPRTNLSLGEETNNIDDFYKYRFGYYAGITFNFSFNNYLGVGGDLIYNLKGYNFDNSNDQKDYIKLHYLELPILITYSFVKNQNFTTNVFLGPYISYLINGRYESVNQSNPWEGQIDWFDDLDYGITGGVSILFPLQSNKVGVDLRYDLGLNNYFKNGWWGDDSSFKNSSFMLGIKFLFNLKTRSSSEEKNTNDDDIWN